LKKLSFHEIVIDNMAIIKTTRRLGIFRSRRLRPLLFLLLAAFIFTSVAITCVSYLGQENHLEHLVFQKKHPDKTLADKSTAGKILESGNVNERVEN